MLKGNTEVSKGPNHFDPSSPTTSMLSATFLCHLSLTRKIQLALVQDVQRPRKFTTWGHKNIDLDAVTHSFCTLSLQCFPSGHFQSHFFNQMQF